MGSPAAPTYGSVMLGVIFNVFLYGVMCTQTFLYFTVYKHDRTWVRLFVLFLLFCDTINSAFDIASLYIPLVTDYGDIEVLKTSNWLIAQDPAMTAIIAFCVQAFFAWRVKVLIGSILLFIVIALCCIAQLIAGIAISVEIVKVHLLAGENTKFGKISIVWLSACAVADVVIAVSLVIWLKRQRTHSEFSTMDALLDKLSRLTIQTGVLTAMCAITSLVLFIASPPNAPGAHLIVNYPLSKLYSNSLMSSLNARAYWDYGDTFTKYPKNTAAAAGAASAWSTHLSFRRPDRATGDQENIGYRSEAIIGTQGGGETVSDAHDEEKAPAQSALPSLPIDPTRSIIIPYQDSSRRHESTV